MTFPTVTPGSAPLFVWLPHSMAGLSEGATLTTILEAALRWAQG